MELQSEVYSWAQVQMSHPFSNSASFLIKGDMLFVGHGLWQVGMIPALRERISSLPESCCAFVPQLSAPCFLLVS